MGVIGDVGEALWRLSFVPNPRQLLQLPLVFPWSSHVQHKSNEPSGPTCEQPQLSCPIATPPAFDECCLNTPSGHFLSTQFWDTSPPLGANNSWTLHGLWPDYCSGGFEQFCDDARSKSQEEIETILSKASESTHPGLLDFMNEHWLSYDSRDSHLWTHEWNKHGTCISTLKPKCYPSDDGADDRMGRASASQPRDILDYFTHATTLYSSLDTFAVLEQNGIIPSHEQTYSLSAIQKAIENSSHGQIPTFKCNNRHELQEVWYHFLVRGSLRDANSTFDPSAIFVPAKADGQLSNCPTSGIKYIPKRTRSSPPSPPPKYPHDPPDGGDNPTPDPNPFEGKGYLKVHVLEDGSDNDQQRTNGEIMSGSFFTGCLIRPGLWYTSGGCARYTAKTDVNHIGSDRRHEDGSSTEELSSNKEHEHEHEQEGEGEHLFTLQSSFAPCSVVKANSDAITTATGEGDGGGGKGEFICSRNLPVQSVFGVMNSSSTTTTTTITTTKNKHQNTVEMSPLSPPRHLDQNRNNNNNNNKDDDIARSSPSPVLAYRKTNVFYADKIPGRFEKVRIFIDDTSTDDININNIDNININDNDDDSDNGDGVTDGKRGDGNEKGKGDGRTGMRRRRVKLEIHWEAI